MKQRIYENLCATQTRMLNSESNPVQTELQSEL